MKTKKKTKNPETSAYDIPDSPVKIPEGDTGFYMIKNSWNKFIMSFNGYKKNNKK